MLLKELVEVNQKGNVANAVNFDMMDDPETNQDLCDSFIFNYDPKKPELSTVGILDRLKESYHSRNEPNVHMMIQQYGKGKSHFAVVLANFFGKPADSPEVHGIVDQVDKATSGSSKVIAEKIKSYKQRQEKPHLVLCLSGDKGGDIRKQFLQVVIDELAAAGVDNAIATHMCREPLNYLEGLSPENKAKADAYLESLSNPDGDVNSLIKQLQKHNPGVIRAVKDVCRHVSNVAPDFQDDINVEAILRDLLDHLCSGESAQFSGILILFDEMNYYLQSWAADQIGAGGTALQNITNICELYKGKIALLSFTQIKLDTAVGISPSVKESYLKLSSRLSPGQSTYDGPASSLELVIDNMLTQKEDTSQWQDFLHRWNDTLLDTARDAFEKRIKTYQQRGWNLEYFYNHLSKGCFPLHPITAYLLCNLDFTQDRTAIQFIKGYVNQFIADKPVEENEYLSYIYPIDLVDTFAENFSNESIYKRYQEACKVVLSSENPDEPKALKALFLYFTSGEKLSKNNDREDHEAILGALAGLSENRMKAALHSLMNTRDLISYKPEIKLYRFWEGISPRGIEDEIEDLIRDKVTSVQSIVGVCQGSRKALLGDTVCVANQFVRDRKLVADDWRYEIKFYTPDALIYDLGSERTMRSTEERGILAYVLAETQEELTDLRLTINDHLAKSPNEDSIAVAIPSEATGDLARVLLKQRTLADVDSQKKRMWGMAACDQLEQRWSEQLITRLRQILESCSYYCITANKVPIDKRNQSSWIISSLLKELYPFVPPVDGIEKLRSDHGTGKKIVKSVASQLLADTLSPQTLQETSHRTVTDSIFVSSWGLLKKTSNKYIPREPKDENLKAAWNEIEHLTDLEGNPEKTFILNDIWKVLSEPPYGYSEYNFTVLFAAWLACHRKEVMLKGPNAVKRNSRQQVSVKQQTLKEWTDTDLFHDPKAFVRSWIVKDRAKLIRKEGLSLPELPNSPMDLSQAQDYLEKANQFLESAEADPEELTGVQRTKAKVEAALEPITAWFQPVEAIAVLTDDAEIATLLELYQQFQIPLPSYAIGADVISVRPTADQREKHDEASQAIATRIEQFTEQVSLRSENLEAIEACDTYKLEVQSLINAFQQTPELPEHLQEILQNASKVSERVRSTLEENARIKQLLEDAQAEAQKLTDYSSQADFTQVIGEIKSIQRQIPTDGTEADEIQQLLQNINRQYQELNQKLSAWEERLTSATTQRQILALLEETAKEQERFTETESQEQISRLRERLKSDLSGIESKSQTETLLKAELEIARQPLQRLRDLSDARIVEAFQAYQELKGFQFAPVEDDGLLYQYQERLEGFKTQGNEQITKRFQQIRDRKLPHLELYENRKELLERALSALEGTEEFNAMKAQLTQSQAELEAQAVTLRQQAENQQKEAEDKDTLKEIQQLRPNQNSTIHFCEEAIAQIQMLQARLHFSEKFQTKISHALQACHNKIQSHKQNLNALREQLATVNTSEVLNRLQLSHARLEAAFRDSSEAAAYHAVGEGINDIKEDLIKLDRLDNRYRQANSITICNQILEHLQSQDLLKYPERFYESRLNPLSERTQQKIKTYQRDLAQIEQQLLYASTPKEIRELQQILLKQSSRYIDSDESEKVEVLNSEIETLLSLMPLLDMTDVIHLEACRIRIQKLISRKESLSSTAQHIYDRIETSLEDLEKRKNKLFIERQDGARKWLGKLNTRSTQIQDAFRDSKKYEIACEILKDIHQNKNSHLEFLDVSECKLLFTIEQQALEEQNKLTENQVLTLFRQLSTSRRKRLYQQLENYLTDQTEEDIPGKTEENWLQKLISRRSN
ncbi:MAG: hypothetical protein F6K00_29525 [Leptolyngbya sp. SIOISBB]|nr:hypothetical protein [Leptolyngbya sp. SIOISBB]